MLKEQLGTRELDWRMYVDRKATTVSFTCQTLKFPIFCTSSNVQSQEKIDLLRMLGAEVYPVPAVAFENPENYNHQAKRHAEKTPNSRRRAMDELKCSLQILLAVSCTVTLRVEVN